MPEDDAGNEAGDANSDEDAEMDEDSGSEGSEDEFYKQVKQQRAAKLAAKAEIYSRFVSHCLLMSETIITGGCFWFVHVQLHMFDH